MVTGKAENNSRKRPYSVRRRTFLAGAGGLTMMAMRPKPGWAAQASAKKYDAGNVIAVKDPIAAIEEDRRPLANMEEARTTDSGRAGSGTQRLPPVHFRCRSAQSRQRCQS